MKLEYKMSLELRKIYQGFFAKGELIVNYCESTVRHNMQCTLPGINSEDVFVVVDFSPVGILATKYQSGRKCFLPLDTDYTAIKQNMIKED